MLHVYKRTVIRQVCSSYTVLVEEHLETLDKDSQQLVHITSALAPTSMTGARVS